MIQKDYLVIKSPFPSIINVVINISEITSHDKETALYILT